MQDDIPPWPPKEMAQLLDAMATAACRGELSYSETAHIARHAATTIYQLMQACGYPVPADRETPNNPLRCGVCDARAREARMQDELMLTAEDRRMDGELETEIIRLRAENERLEQEAAVRARATPTETTPTEPGA